jgi:hypothetical protein
VINATNDKIKLNSAERSAENLFNAWFNTWLEGNEETRATEFFRK